MLELFLIRHGEPAWVVDGLNVDNPPLTDRGHEQARRLAAHLVGHGIEFDEILVSPLVRARQTAAPLLEAYGRHEVIEPWLEEIGNPIWQGTPVEKAEAAFQEIRDRDPHLQWDGIEGGEPVHRFVARIREGVEGFLSARGVLPIEHDLPLWEVSSPVRRIALVAHAGTNAVVISRLLGLAPTPWEWERFVLHHSSVSRMEALPTGRVHTFSLTRLSDVEHLADDLRTR